MTDDPSAPDGSDEDGRGSGEDSRGSGEDDREADTSPGAPIDSGSDAEAGGGRGDDADSRRVEGAEEDPIADEVNGTERPDAAEVEGTERPNAAEIEGAERPSAEVDEAERSAAEEIGGTGSPGGEGEDAADADPADADLTHTDESGDVQMVDVGDKPDAARRAVARGEIRLRPETVDAIRADEVGKGDVLATARVGAVQAVKHTWETIPMCHGIPITNVETAFDVREDRVVLTVAVETTGKTGCEMEALEGTTTGLNVVWDMVKAAEKDDEGEYPATGIDDVRVVSKEKRSVE